VVLFFSISNFFINKESQGGKLNAKKIPTCCNLALSKYGSEMGDFNYDADFGPPSYVLGICQDFFTFIQIGSGHTV
jgi:hypothetical protein